MKTKFKQSNIQIMGTVNIWIDGEHFKNIEVNPVKTGKSGVYCLRNKLNTRLYIGQARNLENRYNRHMRDLIAGEHCNKLILDDYISGTKELAIKYDDSSKSIYYPSDLFEFEVIIYCYPSQLTFWEHLLITNLNPYYNIKKEIPSFEELTGLEEK